MQLVHPFRRSVVESNRRAIEFPRLLIFLGFPSGRGRLLPVPGGSYSSCSRREASGSSLG